MVDGETVLVLGASGVVGQIGVQAARLLGARRIVAAARSPVGLEPSERLGADATVPLEPGADWAQAFRDAAGGGIDIVLDPLWGRPAVAALRALGRRGRLVQVGNAAAAETMVPAAPLRGSTATVLGLLNFDAPRPVRAEAFERMCVHAANGELHVPVEELALDRRRRRGTSSAPAVRTGSWSSARRGRRRQFSPGRRG
jgi:NADPH2:quinone reductase